jgi:hypothetical protein
MAPGGATHRWVKLGSVVSFAVTGTSWCPLCVVAWKEEWCGSPSLVPQVVARVHVSQIH